MQVAVADPAVRLLLHRDAASAASCMPDEPCACRPQSLILLCDFILTETLHPPGEQTIYHTLLQLCLVERLSDEQLADSEAVQASQAQRRYPTSCLLASVRLPPSHKLKSPQAARHMSHAAP